MTDEHVAVLAGRLVELSLGVQVDDRLFLALDVEAVGVVAHPGGRGDQLALDAMHGCAGQGVLPLRLPHLVDYLLLALGQLDLRLGHVDPGALDVALVAVVQRERHGDPQRQEVALCLSNGALFWNV